MPGGEYSSNDAIDAQQNAIKALKESQDNPDSLKQKLDQYQSLFFHEVDSAQTEIQSLSAKLNSNEAKTYLQDANNKIAQTLLNVAKEGQKIKAAKGEKADSIGSLASSLHAQLQAEEAEIRNFAAIEQVDAANDKLDTDTTTDNVDKIIKSKQDLIAKLPASTAISSTLKEKVSQKIRDSITDLTVFKADQVLINLAHKDVAKLSELGKAYEKQQTDETKTQIDQIFEKLDFRKLGDDVFKDKIGNSTDPLISRLYQKLWQDKFESLKNKFEDTKKKIEAKEKESATTQAEVALGVVEGIWKQQIEPKLKKYSIKSDQENLNLEKELLSDLLKTRSLLAPFKAQIDKVEASSGKMLTDKLEEIDSGIRKIEINRETRINEPSFKAKGLLKYIKFINKDGLDTANGQVYNFTPEFYKLSPEEQILIKRQIEEMAAQNKLTVKSETEKANLDFLKPEEKMKKLAEMMGEKGKPYFSALDKLKVKNVEGAVKDYQAYLAQNFSPEEMKLHGEFIVEAQKNIEAFFGEKLTGVDKLLSDIKQLKYSRQKMVGNAELSPADGLEINAIESEISAFYKDIGEGKVQDFQARFNKLSENVRAKMAQSKTESDVLSKLEKLFAASNEKDPEKRKQAFTEFAKEARDAQSYNLAQRYLDYALEDQYKEASKKLSKDEVLKKMLADPAFLTKLNQQSALRFQMMLKENPALKGQLTVDMVKQKMLEQELDSKYKRELRRIITPLNASYSLVEMVDPALGLYNNWFPIDDPAWYDVLNYGAEEWDDFQVECVKFVFEQMPSMGIGMAAGAMGKVGGKMAGKAVGKYLMRAGLKEAEMKIIEEGGLAALKASFKSGKALSYGATRLLGTLALEGGTMYGLGLAHEYLQRGEVADFRSPGENIAEHLAESMFKVAVFKGIGMATSSIKPLAAAMQKGGAAGKFAWLGSETLSGAGGVVLDASLAKLKGHDFTGQEAFQSMLSNYVMSVGIGVAHGKGHSESKETRKFQDAMAKERAKFSEARSTEAQAYLERIGIDPAKPESVSTARFDTDGTLILNGKAVKGFDSSYMDHLPAPLKAKIDALSIKHSFNTHFKSNASTSADIPESIKKETLVAGKSLADVRGWISEDGQIHYNVDYLNAKPKEGGYRNAPTERILLEAYEAVNENGDLRIKSPDGKKMSLTEYADVERTAEGGKYKGRLIENLRSIKNHEAMHRIYDVYKDSLNPRILKLMQENPELMENFNKSGRALNERSIQEFISEIADGKTLDAAGIRFSTEMLSKIENEIGDAIPKVKDVKFSFKRLSTEDTRLLLTRTKEQFARETADASYYDPVKQFSNGKINILGSEYNNSKFYQYNIAKDKIIIAQSTPTNRLIMMEVPLTRMVEMLRNERLRMAEQMPLKKGDRILLSMPDGSTFEAYIHNVDGQDGSVQVATEYFDPMTGKKIAYVRSYESISKLTHDVALADVMRKYQSTPFALFPSKEMLDGGKWILSKIDSETGKVSVKNLNDASSERTFESIDHFLLEIVATNSGAADFARLGFDLQGRQTRYEYNPVPPPAPKPILPPVPKPAPVHAEKISPLQKELAGPSHYNYTAAVGPQHWEEISKALYGRKPINSRTQSFEGKLFLPQNLAGKMVGISVDTGIDPETQTYKDPVLAKYVEKTLKELQPGIGARFFKQTPEKLFMKIAEIIQRDFPYQYLMLQKGYEKSILPNRVHGLGDFMEKRDIGNGQKESNMVCRHMALLAAVILEKANNDINLYKQFPEGTRFRYMADQMERSEKEHSGHAYVIISIPDEAGGIKYYSLDPTRKKGEGLIDLNQTLRQKTWSWDRERYLYSTLRVIFQNFDAGSPDLAFVKEVFRNELNKPELTKIVRDALNPPTDPIIKDKVISLRMQMGMSPQVASFSNQFGS